MASEWVPGPGPVPRSIPLGLELLLPLSQIFLENRAEGGGFGSNNETRHVLYTAQGHMIYVAEEGSLRKRIRKGLEFQEHLRDSVGNGLLLHRPASSVLRVYAFPTGQLLGEVERQFSWCQSGLRFLVRDPRGSLVLVIAPQQNCGDGGTTDILTPNKVGVGQITKTRADWMDPGVSVMTFPPDLEVGMKAVLLAALVWTDACT